MNPDVFKNFQRVPRSEIDSIEDVCDGQIFKDLFKSEFSQLFETNQIFTFSINTDGISICDESNITIWPIFLVINEIPLEKRFCLDNIIVAGKFL
jgi:hypothetical protein